MAIAYLGYRVDSGQVSKAENRLDKMSGAAGRAEQSSARMGKAFAAAAAAAAVATGALLKSAIGEARKFETAMLGIGAVIDATGSAAGRSAEQLRSQAEDIARATLESTEGVLRAQKTLLTFRNVQGDVFDDTIKAAADMSAALGVDMNSAVLQLGKALEDPITGMTALTRSGTVFTQAQKDMVREMVETGRQAEAQAFILSELEAQYGGVAEAAADGLAGAQDSLAQSFQEAKLALADSLGLVQAATAANELMSSGLDFLADNMDTVVGTFIAAAGAITAAYLPAIAAAIKSTALWVAGLVTLKGALIATGIGALVVAAGFLIGQFIKLVRATGSVGGAFEAVKDIAVEVAGRIPAAWNGIQFKVIASSLAIQGAVLGAFASILEGSVKAPEGIVKAFKWAVENITSLFKSIGSIVSQAVGQAVNFVIEKIEGLINKAVAGINTLIQGINEIPGIDIGAIASASLGRVAEGAGGAIASISDFSISDVAEGIRATSDEMKAASETASKMGDAFIGSATRPLEAVDALREKMKEAEGQTQDTNEIVNQLFESMGNAGGGGGVDAINETTNALTELKKRTQSVADTIRQSMSDAFMSIVDGTKSAKDAFKDMARSVIKQLFDILVVQKLVGSFDAKSGTGTGIVGAIMGAFQADGGVWQQGRQVEAFANGGVVNGPTMFGMSGGRSGLMGEAGPEAIMPLHRGANGKLGVQAEGGQGNVTVNQNFNFSANGDDSVKRIIAGEAPKLSAMALQKVMNERRKGGSMKQAFG